MYGLFRLNKNRIPESICKAVLVVIYRYGMLLKPKISRAMEKND